MVGFNPSLPPSNGPNKPLSAPAAKGSPAASSPAAAPAGDDNFKYYSPALKLWFWTAPIAVVLPPSAKTTIGDPIQRKIDDLREFFGEHRRLPD